MTCDCDMCIYKRNNMKKEGELKYDKKKLQI